MGRYQVLGCLLIGDKLFHRCQTTKLTGQLYPYAGPVFARGLLSGLPRDLDLRLRIPLTFLLHERPLSQICWGLEIERLRGGMAFRASVADFAAMRSGREAGRPLLQLSPSPR